jgi:hypothetical protein
MLTASGVAAYLGLHLAAFGRVPDGVTFDTAAEALRGVRLVAERKLEVLTFSVGPSAETLYLYVVGAFEELLGPTRLAMLLPSMLFAAACVLLLVVALSRVDPELPAYVPLALASGSVWLFLYGQAGLRAISAPFFLLLSLLAVHEADRRGTRAAHLLVGAVFGASLYAYSACRVLPLAYALHVAARALVRRKPFARLFEEARFTAYGFLLVSIPNILVAVRLPDEFFARGYYVYRGGAREMLANVAATFLLPFGYPDRYRVQAGAGHIFDGSGVALTAAGLDPIDALTGAAFAIGLVLFVARRRPAPALSFLAAVWASGSLLLGLSGPSLTRVLFLLPVYLVFASLGLDALSRRVRRGRAVLAGALGVWLGVQAWRYVDLLPRSPVTAEMFKPAANAMGERARDLLDGGRRVLLVCTSGSHVVRYYTRRHIDRLYLVQLQGRPLAPEKVPIAEFRPDAILVERTPELAAFAATLDGAAPSARPELYDERHPSLPPSDRPPIPGNVKRIWSDIAR